MADRLVLDTSVLVDFHRNQLAARQYVDPIVHKRVAFIHPVAAAEMLEGVLDWKDQRRTMEFLASFQRLSVKSADFEHCLLLMPQVRLSHSVGWPDCLIAATCIRLGLPLVTLNDKHFRAIRGLRVVRPY